MPRRKINILAYQGLVISIVKQYSGKGWCFNDLVQEGNIGLLIAAKNFDVHLGYKFTTYASYWVHREIQRYLMHYRSAITLPFWAKQISKIFLSEREDLTEAEFDNLTSEQPESDPILTKILDKKLTIEERKYLYAFLCGESRASLGNDNGYCRERARQILEAVCCKIKRIVEKDKFTRETA